MGSALGEFQKQWTAGKIAVVIKSDKGTSVTTSKPSQSRSSLSKDEQIKLELIRKSVEVQGNELQGNVVVLGTPTIQKDEYIPPAPAQPKTNVIVAQVQGGDEMVVTRTPASLTEEIKKRQAKEGPPESKVQFKYQTYDYGTPFYSSDVPITTGYQAFIRAGGTIKMQVDPVSKEQTIKTLIPPETWQLLDVKDKRYYVADKPVEAKKQANTKVLSPSAVSLPYTEPSPLYSVFGNAGDERLYRYGGGGGTTLKERLASDDALNREYDKSGNLIVKVPASVTFGRELSILSRRLQGKAEETEGVQSLGYNVARTGAEAGLYAVENPYKVAIIGGAAYGLTAVVSAGSIAFADKIATIGATGTKFASASVSGLFGGLYLKGKAEQYIYEKETKGEVDLPRFFGQTLVESGTAYAGFMSAKPISTTTTPEANVKTTRAFQDNRGEFRVGVKDLKQTTTNQYATTTTKLSGFEKSQGILSDNVFNYGSTFKFKGTQTTELKGLSSILRQVGYKTGVVSSPTIQPTQIMIRGQGYGQTILPKPDQFGTADAYGIRRDFFVTKTTQGDFSTLTASRTTTPYQYSVLEQGLDMKTFVGTYTSDAGSFGRFTTEEYYRYSQPTKTMTKRDIPSNTVVQMQNVYDLKVPLGEERSVFQGKLYPQQGPVFDIDIAGAKVISGTKPQTKNIIQTLTDKYRVWKLDQKILADLKRGPLPPPPEYKSNLQDVRVEIEKAGGTITPKDPGTITSRTPTQSNIGGYPSIGGLASPQLMFEQGYVSTNIVTPASARITAPPMLGVIPQQSYQSAFTILTSPVTAQGQKSSVSTISSTRTAVSQLGVSSLATNQLLSSKQLVGRSLKYNQIPSSLTSTSLSSRTSTSPIQDVITDPISDRTTTTTTSTITSTIPGIPEEIITPPPEEIITPPVFIWERGMIPFQFGGTKRGKRAKIKTKYKPSIIGITFGVKATKGLKKRLLTGFETRGV